LYLGILEAPIPKMATGHARGISNAVPIDIGSLQGYRGQIHTAALEASLSEQPQFASIPRLA
jgi:hypothetical protein